MKNLLNLLELIKLLYGKNALTKTIGTRTNVISLSNKKLKKYIRDDLDIEAASEAAVEKGYKEMKELIVDLPKMNDNQRLIFEGNLRRLKNKLQSLGKLDPDQTADIINLKTKQPVSGEGITQLVKERGQKNPPGTFLGDLESKINKMKIATDTLNKIAKKETVSDFLNDYFGLQKTAGRGRSLEDQAYVRAVVRQIMYTDFNAGKLKFSKELEEMATGKTNKDPIEVFRTLYGEDALENIDDILPQIKTLTKNMEAEELARSKFNFEPKVDRPKGSYTDEEMQAITDKVEGTSKSEVVDIKNKVSKNVDPDQLIQEYNSNYKLLSQTDEEGGTLIGYEQFNKLQNRNTEIEKILDSIGIKTAPKVKPEGTVIPFKKDDPDKFAGGGSVGLDYLMGIERPYVDGGKIELSEARNLLNRMAPEGEQLAYINDKEANLLKRKGGAGLDINGTGIKSYFDPGTNYQSTFDAAAGMGPTTSSDSGGGGGTSDPKNDPYTQFTQASQPRGGLQGIKDFFTGGGYDYGYQPTFGKFLNSGLGSLALGLVNPVLGFANRARTRGPELVNYIRNQNYEIQPIDSEILVGRDDRTIQQRISDASGYNVRDINLAGGVFGDYKMGDISDKTFNAAIGSGFNPYTGKEIENEKERQDLINQRAKKTMSLSQGGRAGFTKGGLAYLMGF